MNEVEELAKMIKIPSTTKGYDNDIDSYSKAYYFQYEMIRRGCWGRNNSRTFCDFLNEDPPGLVESRKETEFIKSLFKESQGPFCYHRDSLSVNMVGVDVYPDNNLTTLWLRWGEGEEGRKDDASCAITVDYKIWYEYLLQNSYDAFIQNYTKNGYVRSIGGKYSLFEIKNNQFVRSAMEIRENILNTLLTDYADRLK